MIPEIPGRGFHDRATPPLLLVDKTSTPFSILLIVVSLHFQAGYGQENCNFQILDTRKILLYSLPLAMGLHDIYEVIFLRVSFQVEPPVIFKSQLQPAFFFYQGSQLFLGIKILPSLQGRKVSPVADPVDEEDSAIRYGLGFIEGFRQ